MAKLPRRRIYVLLSWCAWPVVATGAFISWMGRLSFPTLRPHSWPIAVIALLAASLVLFGIPAALVLWGAMGYFCSRNYRISKGARIAWFLMFFTIGWYGSALYFFAVYRREAIKALQPKTSWHHP